jgi:hypothetical protein
VDVKRCKIVYQYLEKFIMKIYPAASYPRKEEAKTLALILQTHGHEIVAGWLTEDEGYKSDNQRRNESRYTMCKRLSAAAVRDLREMKDAEVIVSFTEGEHQTTHGGRHSELGIALARGIMVFIIGPREQVFHFHPAVIQYDTLDDFIRLGIKVISMANQGTVSPEEAKKRLGK